MASTVFALFLIAHGLVHIAIYATPKDASKPAPFDPSSSWALAARHTDASVMRSASIALSLAVAAAYAASGWMLLLGGPWAPAAVVGVGLGLALKVLWFDPWLSLGIALDLVIVWVALAGWPA